MKKALMILILGVTMIQLVGCEDDKVITKEETYVVEFDTTYASMIDSVEVKEGQTLDELPTVNREGFYFLGWYLNNQQIDKNHIVVEDIELTARFEEHTEVYDYQVNEHGLVILGYQGELTKLVIPEMIDGTKVYAIGRQAFMDAMIEEIDIPVNVTHIGDEAFLDTPNLQVVRYYGDYAGEMETVIGNEPYDDLIEEHSDVCVKQDDPDYPGDDTKWVFPEGCPIKKVLEQSDVVKVEGDEYFSYTVIINLAYYETMNYFNHIGYRAFLGSTVETIHLPSRYYMFDQLHFEGAMMLKEIIIDDNNQKFKSEDGLIFSKEGNRLFYYPTAKTGTTYTIGKEVEVMYSALSYAKYLVDIEVEENHPLYTSLDGVLYDIDMNTLVVYPSGKIASGFDVPEGVEIIGPMSFYGSTYLEHIVLADTVISIREKAFEKTSLTSIRIPSSVEYIGAYIFKDVMSLQDVVFEGSVSNDTIPSFQMSPFYIGFEHNIYENVKIFVPDDSLDIYKEIGQLRHMKDNIYPLSIRE